VKISADVLAFLSAAFLAFPAWYINRYAHLAARAAPLKLKLPDPELRKIYRETLAELVDPRDGWKPWKAWCLHIGTVAGPLGHRECLRAAPSAARELRFPRGTPQASRSFHLQIDERVRSRLGRERWIAMRHRFGVRRGRAPDENQIGQRQLDFPEKEVVDAAHPILAEASIHGSMAARSQEMRDRQCATDAADGPSRAA